MKYHKIQIKLDNPLTFLKYFKNEESFFFYNPLKKEFIFGAKRLKALSLEECLKDYPYTFSSMTFFNSIKDEKWSGFGNENIAFEYYLIEKKGIQTLYYLKDFVEIENMKVEFYRHSFRYEMDDYNSWEQLFSAAHNAILNKELNKVVISREVKIKCNGSINTESILQNLLKQNANSFIFSYRKDGKTFLGATPEILIQKEKNNILSYALAGTVLRSYKEDEGEGEGLLVDIKNRHEHQIVIDSIVNSMRNFTDELTVDETKILELKNLYHLQTCIHGKNTSRTLLQWVKLLHPTPALGGDPVNKALELIKRYEKHERGLYAAPIGIIDENGDGIFVVGIRSALIEKNIVYAYSGCGIVDKSNCKSEYIETTNKLKTIIESLSDK
ncbi:menaquinone-specific isochorismate synthase [Clostridium pasteurianum DSM 525 = ATCC 6013]|uniref:isochorismate synthase n=1 Tax=Clostridium pasteurianum DSM 525 = ATCC 6013 TaxID=1262449 RepID=A0A0H3JAJ8_CLOPA|nr:isochorismate synthase [Clostridium pasteurianum]AJA48620.1 menaquinone-specific isochorismate synthase [Clostridium pasteurianum DSM 525 = ATCC 6013]AJA52608.1 menaquinone-specific isochorismate synthase [Clostridium pasteurianum DSM 525 = ATCC 6013]AOZ75850.1 isochorismate synthase [Clostridium pasteurianum DSM 525 = ATCC 6013]AOZ79646.1 isochorismate synthase [Clostridium pasteurianum]ELP57902.1 menaquinone-specific isochorismate synthase [Clostridium pasteurianum DSM 525 = ATCC 6013]